MTKSEKNIEDLELKFPDLAAAAVSAAYIQAIKAGRKIIVSSASEQGIVEISPDGSTHFLKKLDPPLRIAAGTVVQIP